jgi:hypothetical protein
MTGAVGSLEPPTIAFRIMFLEATIGASPAHRILRARRGARRNLRREPRRMAPPRPFAKEISQ